MKYSLHPAGMAMVCLLLAAGCGETVDPRIAELRQALVLASAPGEETSISRIRTALQEDGAAEEVDVIIRGRITAGDFPPWEPGKAAFILTDATGHEGESDHDPWACPFCSRNIDDYLAKVRFYQNGSVIDIDARELFNVTDGQLVLITGKAVIDDEDKLAVSADGMYIVP
ncbi:MAG: hypothetical protein RIK87_15440 [Fuerstiella sp.]